MDRFTKVARIRVLDGDMEAALPKFHYDVATDDEGRQAVQTKAFQYSVSGRVPLLTCKIGEGFRHISIAELVDLMCFKVPENTRVFGRLFWAYALRRGITVQLKGIFTNVAAAYDRGPDRMFYILNDAERWLAPYLIDTEGDSVFGGYALGQLSKDEQLPDLNSYSLGDLHFGTIFTVRDIYAKAPELAKALFGKERFEELPMLWKSAELHTPGETTGWWSAVKNVLYPLCVDIRFELEDAIDVDGLLNDSSDGINSDLHSLRMTKITIYPSDNYESHAFLVRDPKSLPIIR